MLINTSLCYNIIRTLLFEIHGGTTHKLLKNTTFCFFFCFCFFFPRNGFLRPREYHYFSFPFSLFSYSSHLFCVPLGPFLRPCSTLPFFFIFHKNLDLFKFFPYCSLSRQLLSVIFNFSVSSLICFTYPTTLLYSRILSKTLLFILYIKYS